MGIILVYNFFGFQNQETEEISLFANNILGDSIRRILTKLLIFFCLLNKEFPTFQYTLQETLIQHMS